MTESSAPHDAVTLELAKKESAEHLAGMTEIFDTFRHRPLIIQAYPLHKDTPTKYAKENASSSHRISIKTIHLLRHGQGFHNLLADRAKASGVTWTQFANTPDNPYMASELTDAPLTHKGRLQALAVRENQVAQLAVPPQLVVLSPQCRALQTGLVAFADIIGQVPFVAHELVREQTGIHVCDQRRSRDFQSLEFPHVDFSLLTSNHDELFQSDQRETHAQVANRAYRFLEWLAERNEDHVAIASHSAWLLTLLNGVVEVESEELKAWFQTGEMRSSADSMSSDQPTKSSSRSKPLGKTVVVFKKRRIDKILKPLSTVVPSRGLPPSAASTAKNSRSARQSSDAQAENNAGDAYDDAMFQNMACETLLVAQSLLQNPATSLSIPFANDGSQSIQAILPCQLYQTLQSTESGADVVVSRELQALLHDGVLVKLAPAGKVDSDDAMSVLILTQDYIQAVRNSSLSDAEFREVVEWFLGHLHDFGASYVSSDAVQRVLAKDPLVGHTAESILQALCKSQVLLSCPQRNQANNSSYQYWLPTWGLVIKAWNKACTTLLASLKRSHYKERKEQALQQPHSPIPTRLLLDWLMSQGVVERVERASGNMIRLIQDE